ncbi:hypothetical protein [Bradyrhizobium sp. 197]|uniref:hypothetical protein n=1 Tax=unclassified Bradyrhizobium TaxID=2631580 RepID=UPI001FF7AF23
MLDATTTTLLRAVLEEVCDNLPRSETGTRAHVASKILEAANKGEITAERLRQVAMQALRSAPTMWR